MNNTETILVDSKPNPKCALDAATDSSQSQCGHMQRSPVSSLTSSFQNINHNRKRPNSFPFSYTPDCSIQTERARILSRLISYSESPINGSQTANNLQNNTRIPPESLKNFNLPLPNHTTNEREPQISTDLQPAEISTTKFRSCESATSSKDNERTLRNFNKNSIVTAAQNFISTSPEEESGTQVSKLPSSTSKRDVRVVEHVYEEIDESDDQCANKCSEFKACKINTNANGRAKRKFQKNRAFFVKNKESVNPVNQRWRGNQVKFNSPDNEESKVETEPYNIEYNEDEIWKYYTERPLLPLKPMQKQRSMSCVNLVQTIKGLSKKKANSSSRHSSPINNTKNLLFPENALIQKKDMCTSQANISEIRTELVASSDYLTVRRMSDADFAEKNIRQSLLPNYTWFHPVDAKEASKRLLKMQLNGAFLIRPASNPTSEVLHTLCVVCSRRVYNFHVKSLKDGRITLGKVEKKQQTFSTLLEMIKYHQTVPISINLIDSNQMTCVYLLITPPK